MTDNRWARVKEIFDAALQRRPEERAEYLDRACSGDKTIREEVESLLSSFGRADGFMQTPAFSGEDVTIRKQALAAGETLGHYRIERLLGVGGMGEVYLARDRKLDRHVAVKVVSERFEKGPDLQRFLQEARAASALNHPNILVIHEVGEAEGSHYIVSEYVEGSNLREYLAAKKLTLAEALDIGAQVAGALTAAHAAHIVHRDIKPENIMIRPDGLVKILDFGLAKLVEQKNRSMIGPDDETAIRHQTEKGIILGTVSYMSPEQARGDAVDERTDVFSLGVLIYEMIAGRTPFAADSMPETFANLINKEAPPLAEYSSEVPDEVQEVVSRALKKDRNERYPSVKALLADLAELKNYISFSPNANRKTFGNDQNETAILHGPTGDVASPTVETAKKSWPLARRIAVIAAGFVLILSGLIAFAWYRQNQAASPAAAQIKSLAVLPFRPTADEGDSDTAVGIADSIIRRISISSDLIVRPTSAVLAYLGSEKDPLTAARELGVDAVLDGTVKTTDGNTRVAVNLLRVADGSSMWSDSFDVAQADLFTVQDSVAKEVAARLKIKLDAVQQQLLVKRTTSNPQALKLFTKAMFHFGKVRANFVKHAEELDTAIEQFDNAIALDPEYALAYAQRGYAYAWKAIFLKGDATDIEKAKASLRAAERIDPQLPDVHVARAFMLWSQYDNWDVHGAIREVRMAQSLDPNAGHNELAEFYIHIGLEEQGFREKEIALTIDPTNDEIKRSLVNLLYLTMRTDEALEADKKYFGRGADFTYFFQKKMFDKAIPLIEEYLGSSSPKDTAALDYRALLYAIQGKHKEADATVREMIPLLEKNRAYHHSTYDIACIYALAGNTEEAIKWLRITSAWGFSHYPLLQREWGFDPIRNDPQFVAYMNEVREIWERNNREYQ